MIPEELEWNIKVIKDRHQGLNLTFEQAEQIYKFEQDKYIHSEKHFFSVWEEWDYEVSTFRQILTTDQLKVYEEEMAENIKRYEQSLVDEDGQNVNKIEYVQKILSYYENEFLPDLFSDSFITVIPKLGSDKMKIDFLKSEYKIFLNDKKMSVLIEHFRHNRIFKPKELQVSLLRHKISCLWPAYSAFKFSADHAVKAVIDYVKTRIVKFPEKSEKLLDKKITDLKAFNKVTFKEYYGESSGWHTIINQANEEEEKEELVMRLLLLDKEKYG